MQQFFAHVISGISEVVKVYVTAARIGRESDRREEYEISITSKVDTEI